MTTTERIDLLTILTTLAGVKKKHPAAYRDMKRDAIALYDAALKQRYHPA